MENYQTKLIFPSIGNIYSALKVYRDCMRSLSGKINTGELGTLKESFPVTIKELSLDACEYLKWGIYHRVLNPIDVGVVSENCTKRKTREAALVETVLSHVNDVSMKTSDAAFSRYPNKILQCDINSGYPEYLNPFTNSAWVKIPPRITRKHRPSLYPWRPFEQRNDYPEELNPFREINDYPQHLNPFGEDSQQECVLEEKTRKSKNIFTRFGHKIRKLWRRVVKA